MHVWCIYLQLRSSSYFNNKHTQKSASCKFHFVPCDHFHTPSMPNTTTEPKRSITSLPPPLEPRSTTSTRPKRPPLNSTSPEKPNRMYVQEFKPHPPPQHPPHHASPTPPPPYRSRQRARHIESQQQQRRRQRRRHTRAATEAEVAAAAARRSVCGMIS